jgi:hypothetical protein
MKLDAVFAELLNLTADELRQVSARCQSLPAVSGTSMNQNFKQTDAGPFLEGLYLALCDELKHRIKADVIPYRIFAKAKANLHRTYVLGAKAASVANESWFPDQTRAEQASMVKLYAKLILDHLEEIGTPLLWPVIVHYVEALPGIIDAAFPGYARAGLLGKVQTLRTKGAEQADSGPVAPFQAPVNTQVAKQTVKGLLARKYKEDQSGGKTNPKA